MRNSWMLDVLTDLKDFADQNGMQTLAEELSRVRRVAELEFRGGLTVLVSGEGQRHAGFAGAGHREPPERHGS